MNLLKIILLSAFLISCGIVDSGEIELIDDYTVGWVDTGCSMKIYKGEHGQMKGQVYGVGWNENFIVAKRHPECNNDITDYYIIDININKKSVKAGVFGPYDKIMFLQQRKNLKVPKKIGFTLKP